jgi:transposase
MHLLDKILDKNIDPETLLALKNELSELTILRQKNHAYEIQNKEFEIQNKEFKIQAKSYITQIEELSSLVSQQASQIKMNQFKIDQLIFDLARKKNLLYAAKNESMSAEQRTLFEEDFKTDIAAIEDQLAELNQAQKTIIRQQEKPVRSSLPAHLPRVKIVHEPASCDCDQCGNTMIKIGEDISEKLDIKPAEFFVLHNIYVKYACRACEVVRATPVAPAVIDSGIAAPGLLAWIMVSKYVDHLPLYRLEKIAARQEVSLSLSSMSEWVGKTGVLLDILGQRLADKLRAKSILHADETPVQQLAPGEGKTRRAYLWAYRSSVHDPDPPIVIFDYQTSRAGKHCVSFLKDWRGNLMVDDYGGYKILFKTKLSELM